MTVNFGKVHLPMEVKGCSKNVGGCGDWCVVVIYRKPSEQNGFCQLSRHD